MEAAGTTLSGGTLQIILVPQASISLEVTVTNALPAVLLAQQLTNATTARLALKMWRLFTSVTASPSARTGLTGKHCS